MSEQGSDGRVLEAAKQTIGSSRNAAAEVAKTAQAGAQNVGDAITRNAEHVANKVNTKLKEVATDAEPLVSAARAGSRNLRNALVEEVKSRPLQALIAAALAGLAIGVLASR